MPNHVLQLDCTTAGTAGVIADTGISSSPVWISFEASFSSALLTHIAGLGGSTAHPFGGVYDDTESYELEVALKEGGTNWSWIAFGGSGASGDHAASFSALQAYLIEIHVTAGSPYAASIFVDGVSWGSITPPDNATGFQHYELDPAIGSAPAGSYVYIDNFKVGSTRGASDILSDDFEGSLPGVWGEYYDASVASIVADPGITAPVPGAVTADFSGTPTSGSTPLTVAFTDSSTPGPSGPITHWAWDFGDGSISDAQNPSHVYTGAALYTVTLTVTGTGADGTDTLSRVAYIDTSTAGAPIHAQFTGTPTRGVAPLTVNFYDESTPGPSGPITAWNWDFGDGNTSTSQNPSNTYANPGTYEVILLVTGTSPDGTDSEAKGAYIITGGGSVLANFSASPTSGSSPLAVDFTDASIPGPSGPIVSWHWNLGDGNTSTQQNPSHTYTTSGSFTVELTVTGTGSDGTDTFRRTSYVRTDGGGGGGGSSPIAAFNWTRTDLTANFFDTSIPGSSGPITAWSWDFGDGDTSTSQNPSHTYGAAGSYIVKLIVTGTTPDGASSITHTLTVSVGSSGSGGGGTGGGGFGGGSGGSGGGGSSGGDLVDALPDASSYVGRVLIAFDDGPLEPNPTFTAIDQGGAFPDQFVSGYDTQSGRQTLLSQTDTGTASVFINDHEQGLFDPRNTSSPYFGKLDGRQIALQLFNPVTGTWHVQFRGWIDDITWNIDGSAVDANGDPINASIQIECVDMFDFLAGFGLTPGLAGVAPLSGMEDGVYYAEGHVDDRIIEILTDAGIDSSMFGSPTLASGNVRCIATKYDPDESALQAIRDAVDAEFPFIGICYCDRHGKFQFHGRYARFAPDTVSGEPGSDWDFTRWAVGDEKAIQADPTRAQMRALSFARNRSDIINAAICYPQGLAAVDMPGQVYADTTAITAYGKHDAPPMSDLLTANTGLSSGNPDAKTECFDFAKLLVKNKKDPREALTALQVKAIRPADYRAPITWAFLTRTDISHIVNVQVGYPSGTGFSGASPEDDYYIEGRALQVRPLNPSHDYVELNLEVSPAVWSMDTHGVFPGIGDLIEPTPSPTELTAAFSFD